MATAWCCLPFGSVFVALRQGEPFRPEDFGARGDGISNDSAAFAALADRVNRAGGGVVEFRPVTYILGAQWRANGAGTAYRSMGLLEFVGCREPLVIRGNGATFKLDRGLRYGSFEPGTGRTSRRAEPNYERNEVVSPYSWMVMARDCLDWVEISDLELDGNLAELELGGLWGGGGRQIRAYGIGLYDNRGPELVRNVYTHHHALDGLVIDGLDQDRLARSRIEGLRSEYNGRQGCSVVGGRGYDFLDCRFAHTGMGGLVSSPGGGLDIEAESKRVRDLSFINCEFADNAGPGLVADSGESEGAVFRRCTFIGTTTWSAWPKKPNFRFHDSTFVGAISNAFSDAERPDRATQFHGCRFVDDPMLSPTGQVFKSHADTTVELSSHPNVLFKRCRFDMAHGGTLPWTNAVTYDSCSMAQTSDVMAFPRGRYIGRSSIFAPSVQLGGSVIEGELTVNGSRLPRGRLG